MTIKNIFIDYFNSIMYKIIMYSMKHKYCSDLGP
jgi:hypothetical protein